MLNAEQRAVGLIPAQSLALCVRFDFRKGILLGGLGLNNELCLLLHLPFLGFKRFIKREKERYELTRMESS